MEGQDDFGGERRVEGETRDRVEEAGPGFGRIGVCLDVEGHIGRTERWVDSGDERAQVGDGDERTPREGNWWRVRSKARGCCLFCGILCHF